MHTKQIWIELNNIVNNKIYLGHGPLNWPRTSRALPLRISPNVPKLEGELQSYSKMFYLTTWNEPCWSSTSSQIITLTNDSTSSAQTRKVFPGVFVNNHLHTHPIPFSNSARICTDVRFQIIYFPTHKIETRIQSYCAYIIRFHYTYIFNTLYLINNSSLF